MKKKTIDIVIGGDVAPIGKNKPFFLSGDAKTIFNDILCEFESADLSIVNLECPLVTKKTPIGKCGPALGVEGECVNGLKEAKIDVANLANNHIMDHGASGLGSSMRICAEHGIATLGAGKNLTEARKMFFRDFGKIRVGILAFTEHEFSVATYENCGANPLSLIEFVRSIKKNRDKFDYLIVLLHGGSEYYPYPSPRIKETCRFMVEMGADAVIQQHTHCPGCIEDYKGGHIIYGQGNLIFDAPNKEKSFYQGFLVKLSIHEDFSSEMSIIPFDQSYMKNGASRMSRQDESVFMQEIEERSNDILSESFVNERWLEFCSSRKNEYLKRLFGMNSFFDKLIVRGFLINKMYTNQALLRLKNTVSCEAHREVLEIILEKYVIK